MTDFDKANFLDPTILSGPFADSTHPKLGDVVAGKYRLDYELGRGGMGVVYRAEQLNLGRPVALKLLLQEHLLREGAVKRFEREAKVAASLRHPNAVQIFEWGVSDEVAYIAMEMIEGASLRSFLDGKNEIAVDRVWPIASQIAEVLIEAHRIQLVHRDLKPENILIEQRPQGERVVVLDFGLAFLRDQESSTQSSPNVMGRLTEEGVISGTPHYMSPEQARGEALTSATDVYALGCLIYEMLTGTTPFQGHTLHVVSQQLFSIPAKPSVLRSNLALPTEGDDLVMAMLQKETAKRPSAQDVWSDLQKLSTGHASDRTKQRAAMLEGRAARMLSTLRPPSGHETRSERNGPVKSESAIEEMQMAVHGTLTSDLTLGLMANGISYYILSEEQSVSGAEVVLVTPSTNRDQLWLDIQTFVATGVPVLAVLATDDFELISRCLELGAFDVVVSPISVDELVRKVKRAAKKRSNAKGPIRNE